tara:strand:- start:1 stop:1086 length:1086 start_codon:yes stop_codon:yes gene_type:complete
MRLETVEVSLSENSYSIEIGHNIFLEDSLCLFEETREVLLVYDQNANHLLEKLENLIKPLASDYISIGVEASEENKSQKSVDAIHNLLLDKGFSRKCLLIGLGGGIVCDLCGFAAATYQRGVDFLLVPTTLLAQVDASVGGKTAINHPMGKNMIGSFHQPSKVIIDTSFLSTLSTREIKSGMVEMIKHGIIENENYFTWLEENIDGIAGLKENLINEAIKTSIEIKSNIVSQDEKESGIRAILNFGHTFGHGLELIGGYEQYNHGEAVALGILCAAKLSEFSTNLPTKDSRRIKSIFSTAGIITSPLSKIDPEDLYSAMQSDKKKEGNELNFIVLEKIGSAKKMKGLSKEIVLEAIKSSLS